jgi:hypothetical protein
VSLSASPPDGRRFLRPDELAFQFTTEPMLVRRYQEIYETEFRAVHHAMGYRTVEDEHDRRANVLIVRHGDACVGGTRLSYSVPGHRHPLPIEMGDFRLADHFPHLGGDDAHYGQVGRFCLLPEYRGGSVTREMLWHIHRRFAELGVRQVFATAPITNARAYMQNFAGMGLREPRLHQDIELPEYPMCEGLRFYLISVMIDWDRTMPAQSKEAEEA